MIHRTIIPYLLGALTGVIGALPAAAQQQPPQVLTEQDLQAMEDLGSLVGRQAGEDARTNEPVHQQGANEHSAGRVRIRGHWFDLDKVTGGKEEVDKVDRAAQVEADGDMEDLRVLHDEVDAEIAAEGETTARSKAYKATHDSDDVFEEGRQMVMDTNWDSVQEAFEEADEGMLGEDTFPHCETTRTVTPGTRDVTVTDQEVCEKVILANGDENGVACTRERVCTGRNDEVSGERVAELYVSTDVSAQSCSRTSEVETHIDTISIPNHLDTTVSVNNETGGLICTRTRNITGGGGTNPVAGQMMHEPMIAGGIGDQCPNDVILPIPANTTNLSVSVESTMSQWDAGLVSVIGNRVQYAFTRVCRPGQHCDVQLCETPNVGEVVRITWNGTVSNPIQWGLGENGDCSLEGTPNCPASWSCTQTAPTTIGGIPVTIDDVAGLAPLFPGAPNTCVAASKSRECSGSPQTNNEISIAHLIPPGATEIANFTLTVQNPQPGVTVTVTQVPSAANNWVAIVQVTRTSWATQPVNPNIRLSWNAIIYEERYELIVNESGDCSTAEEGGFCPLTWECSAHGPGMLDGQMVTQEMLDARGPLYPADVPPTCLAAELSNECTGSGSAFTEIDLSPDIPDYVEELRSYQWEVITPSPGVSVTQVQAPTLENGWKAIFRTDRTDWSIVPTPPEVRLSWLMDGETYYDCEIVETGNCGVTSDEFCDAEWNCTRELEDPVDPGTPGLLGRVTTDPMLFAYALPGIPHSATVTFPARLFPAGTTSVENFSWHSTSTIGTGQCLANVTGKPTPGNPHTNVTVINGPSGGGGGGGGGCHWCDGHDTQIVSTDELPLDAPVRLAERILDTLIPTAYAQASGCGMYLVFSWDNYGYTVPPPDNGPGPFPDDVLGEPPLFDGDGGRCMQAELGVDCDAIWVGEECYTNSDGEEVCVDQPPSETPDTCGELEADENCTLVMEECAEGGQAPGGHCYVRSYLYECERTFTVPSPIIEEVTECTDGTAGMPTICMDGSCLEEEPEVETTDILEPAARMMIIQHQMKDYHRVNTSPNPPGGGGNPNDPQVPIINQ